MRKAWILILGVALALPYAAAQTSATQTNEQSSATSSSSDSTLQKEVQDKFAADAAFKNVKASVSGGVVDLSGTVTSQPDQKRAKDLASSVSGVKSVNEHLSIGEAGAMAATESAAVPQTAQSETTKNTAGSIAGVFVSGYVLIDYMDVPDIFRATGVLTLLLAGVSLLVDGWFRRK